MEKECKSAARSSERIHGTLCSLVSWKHDPGEVVSDEGRRISYPSISWRRVAGGDGALRGDRVVWRPLRIPLGEGWCVFDGSLVLQAPLAVRRLFKGSWKVRTGARGSQ